MQILNVQMFNTIKNATKPFLTSKSAKNPIMGFTGAKEATKDTFTLSNDNNINFVPFNVRRYLGDDVKYLDKAKEILNNTPFKFKIKNDEFEGTLREYFEFCKTGERPIIRYDNEIYHGTTRECVDSMIKGLDYTKNSTTKCGPGTYFSPSQAVAMIFGRAFLGAKYIGNKTTMPSFRESFYEPVMYSSKITNTLCDELNIDNNTASKLLKVCAHDILVDDMGIDILVSSSGYGSSSYYVVLNDNCMRLSRA